ncbi:twin-arginine translocase subunit TatC [Archaeoglobus veneficus]|uniref:twin-arginine translocase subunit TatC n=1 Tax=Archaeoglobus veneficus TaxID=58290 RepID=UPI000A45F959|nr:twin-arginine translocase subunit TatC [Archaeoglobus veneficus]
MHPAHPPEDREMELREHLAELKSRTTRVLIVIVAGMAIVFQFSSELIKRFWMDVFREELDMVVYTPTEWIMARLAFSFVLTFFVAYPYIVYELYLFAKPGLYEHERKFVKTFLPFSYLLFLLGTALAYFVVIPKLYGLATSSYLGAEPFLSVKKTLYGAFKIFLAFGLAFQIPVLAVIAVRIGLIDSKWLKEKRLIIYIAVFILATNVTLDITGLSQIVILGLVVVMYELSIAIAGLMEGKRENGMRTRRAV